jgi:hypothetical protein
VKSQFNVPLESTELEQKLTKLLYGINLTWRILALDHSTFNEVKILNWKISDGVPLYIGLSETSTEATK